MNLRKFLLGDSDCFSVVPGHVRRVGGGRPPERQAHESVALSTPRNVFDSLRFRQLAF